MVLAHRGRLALHASAAITGDGALAFAGKAGWGKSTICASLAHAGGSPLADDCLVIVGRRGRFFAIPSYPGLRLWPDTVKALGRRVHDSELVSDHSEKRRITSRRSDIRRRSPVPLRAIYVLSPPRRRRVIRIARIEPREAVGRLLGWIPPWRHVVDDDDIPHPESTPEDRGHGVVDRHDARGAAPRGRPTVAPCRSTRTRA